MVIETRYRDVPWEEIENCYRGEKQARVKKIWNSFRGSPVRAVAPPESIGSDERGNGTACGGPFYLNELTGGYVCPHIAEIGD